MSARLLDKKVGGRYPFTYRRSEHTDVGATVARELRRLAEAKNVETETSAKVRTIRRTK